MLAFVLPKAIITQHLHCRCRGFDEPLGACILGGVGQNALFRDIDGRSFDLYHIILKIDVLPLQAAKLLTAQAKKQQGFYHGLVLQILLLEQFKQLRRLFFVEIARFLFFFVRQSRTAARVSV